MEALEKDHNKILWKQRKLEDLREVVPMSDAAELHSFDDFVIQNWNYAGDIKQEVY